MQNVSTSHFTVGQTVRVTKDIYQAYMGLPHPQGVYYKTGLEGKVTQIKNRLTDIGDYDPVLGQSKRTHEDCVTVHLYVTEQFTAVVTLSVTDAVNHFGLV